MPETRYLQNVFEILLEFYCRYNCKVINNTVNTFKIFIATIYLLVHFPPRIPKIEELVVASNTVQ